MKLTRRQVAQLGLLGLSSLSSLAALSNTKKSGSQPLSILVLGGTGFLGPHIVNRALENGHTVTLFNRGKTDPHLFPDLEKLKGQRGGNLAPLRDRKWDAVIDTSTFIPNQVAKSATLLKPNVGQYIFISSTAVYKDWASPKMNEESPIYDLKSPEASNYNSFQGYGASKAACEETVREIYPEKNTIIRSDTIVGPGDRHHRYTYWIKRASEGGEILGPGKAGDYVQYIDVRDLAQWIVYCAEHAVEGTYNASSPASTYTMGKMINDCQVATKTDSSIVWVDSSFLDSQPPVDIPFWNRNQMLAVGRLSVERAMKNGLTQRPKLVTAEDVFKWYQGLSKERQILNAGLTRSDERQLIDAWKKSQSNG